MRARLFSAALVALLLSACTALPPASEPHWAGRYKNACLPEAIAMTEHLRVVGIQSKVLSIHTEKWGHALCVYLYPSGKNRLWAWDSHWQSVQLRAWWDDPDSIARAWMAWRHDPEPITLSYFHQ